ncbi:MAG: Lrp/AsnC family transcriptional regulator [Thermococci archaeon]|nr:Lrp/AsnC family transcriptional regulator [Thermococci archaeon]
MDDLDLKILRLLQKNGRLSYREIARELKVAVGTVYNRMKKMEEKGIILRFVPVIDYEKVGFGLTAIIGVRANGKKIVDIEREVAKHPRVTSVYDVTGEYDVYILAKFTDREDMNRFVKWLLSIDGVERTNTSVVMQIVKEGTEVEL